jgi:TetR/AcrR family transcriptional regulator, repressor for neighboring sulfatase
MKKGRQNNTFDSENKTKTNGTGKIPYGRDAVKKAILDATEKLLLKKPPGKITVREIAEAAKIKHPLIHRHFGTKEEVIVAVHARAIAKAERKVAGIENLEGNIGAFFETVKNHKFRHIALTRAMLDSVHPRELPAEFPLMARLLELVKKRFSETNSEPKFTPEIISGILAAAILGWLLYEPFLIFGTNQEDKEQNELHKEVVEVLEEILRQLC